MLVQSFKQIINKLNKRHIAIISALFVCVLLFLLVYTTSVTQFTLDSVLVCKNLGKDMTPIDVVNGETKTTDRLILCFDYSNAKPGLTLRVVWYYNDKQVTDDSLKLSKTDGNRSVALLANNGSYLPQGAYCVKIFLGDDLLKQISFVIS